MIETKTPDLETFLAAIKEKLKYSLHLMTPQEATSIAERNGLDFSKLSPRDQAAVMAYGRAMATGRWLINGDTLIFDEDGNLVDGALRILACIRCNTSFPTFQVHNVPKGAKYTVDTHLKRTTAQHLAIEGRANSHALAATATIATSIAASGLSKSKHALSPAATSLFIEDHPEVSESIVAMRGTPLAKATTINLASAMHFLANSIDPGLAAVFFGAVSDAILGKATDASSKSFAAALSEPTEESGTRPSPAQVLVQAWNGFFAGKGMPSIAPTAPSKNELAPPHRLAGLHDSVFGKYHEAATDEEIVPAVVACGGDVHAFYRDMVKNSPAKMAVKLATPEWAREKLLKNGPAFDGVSRNRPLTLSKVKQLARDIVSSNWEINGQTAKLSEDGRLLDGQHRLHAIIEADMPVPILVVTGLHQAIFATLDMGARRPFADHLRAEKVENHNELQGALRIVWQYFRGEIGRGDVMTNSEMHAAWNAHSDIRNFAGPSNWVRDSLNRYISIATLYLFSTVDKEAALVFFRKLADEDDMDEDHPILVLANALHDMAHRKRGIARERDKMFMIVSAWNLWRQEETTDSLQPGRNPKVPTILGLQA